MVCNALAAGSQLLQAEQQGNCATESHNFPHPGRIACCSACNSRPPTTKALRTICGNNTSSRELLMVGV